MLDELDDWEDQYNYQQARACKAEPWQARAEALLDVFKAAWNLVGDEAVLIDYHGNIKAKDYQRLRQAVMAYRQGVENEKTETSRLTD